MAVNGSRWQLMAVAISDIIIMDKQNTESLMGAIPWGFSIGGMTMGYRKVGCAEQIWYIIKYKLQQLFRRRK